VDEVGVADGDCGELGEVEVGGGVEEEVEI
jgi:hypothetical protein